MTHKLFNNINGDWWGLDINNPGYYDFYGTGKWNNMGQVDYFTWVLTQEDWDIEELINNLENE